MTEKEKENPDLEITDFYKLIEKEGNEALIILHMNIRSLNANFTELEHVLHDIYLKVDVIILTECWLQNIELYVNALNKFTLLCSNKRNRSGGVAMFYNEEKLKMIHYQTDIIDACDSILVQFEKANMKQLELLGVYRSPSENILRFVQSLKTLIEVKNTKAILGCIGDFNLCSKQYFSDKNVEYFYDLMLENGFLETITSATRVTANTSSLIDQIFIHKHFLDNNETKCGNVLTYVTDHYLQYMIMKNQKTIPNTKQHRPLIKCHNDKFIKMFVNSLKEVQFDYSTTEWKDVNFLFKDFQSVMEDKYQCSFPTITLSRKMTKNKPWFDKICEKTLKKKTTLYKKYIQSKDKLAKEKYETQNKLYKKTIRNAKNEYNKKLIQECKKPRDTWKLINSFLGKPKTQKKIQLKIKDTVIENDKEAANTMNKYFNDVGGNYGCDPPTTDAHKHFMNSPSVMEFQYDSIHINEIKILLNNLKHNKSSNDIIPGKILKLVPDNILHHLVKIFNLSVKVGVFPENLKHTKIIPVYKQGSPFECNNYRPISLLSHIDKLFEKAICSRIYNFLQQKDYFCSNQYGFRSKHNSEFALLSLMDRIYRAIDQKQYVVLLSVDLRKAFDVIRHDILIEKLDSLGIRGPMLNWFRSYLYRRHQQTYVNGSISTSLEVKFGVPQGSSLGPLLYLIYFNDIKNLYSENDINIFADDTCLLSTDEDIHVAMNKMKENVSKLEEFITANGIRINETKTEYMIIGPKGKPTPDLCSELLYRGKALRKTDKIKMLGVIIDEKLSFKKHIEILMNNRLRKFLPIFYRMRQFMSTDCMLKIYHSQVHSLISYCILVYGNGSKTMTMKLERLQVRILKFLFHSTSSEVP